MTMIVFMLLFQSCTSRAEDQSEGMACHAALHMNHLNLEGITGDYIQKACKTINVYLIDDSVASPDGIKHAVAMKMARAWKITHEGTLENMWKNKFINIFKNNECMVIYKLNFASTTFFDGNYPGITYQEMENYFIITDYASFPRTDGKPGTLRYKFADYVQSKAGEGTYWFMDEDNNGLLDEVIKPGNIYGIAVASTNSGIFGRSGFPKTGGNLLIFGRHNELIETGCQDFAI